MDHIQVQSISSCAQYVTLQKKISDPTLVFIVYNPTHKSETGTANGLGE
jgi:hypothetical protein